jgi:hypothetical protein
VLSVLRQELAQRIGAPGRDHDEIGLLSRGRNVLEGTAHPYHERDRHAVPTADLRGQTGERRFERAPRSTRYSATAPSTRAGTQLVTAAVTERMCLCAKR